ncbi:ABC transporter substrate-binding protein [Thermosipho atlanticus]|uniref:Amino acid/amide ABC transporter substrate-binding protein, HAAT family (TC 3.A.1.4.-) n=1 Tax=Thermosipho atlanticus DSM 15807 TaxID=1123380 RepID=A0A1M5QRT3_9BACT|nr:ABC transporter substrate-binding protein [Thermosipho atlanticus]SHH16834.1 amino acid/amide ABC transporter substrate-binding protein, HAAT family (TC 3.A.1.4.-) [Thermosipho atlanticus DSM 15807]
MKKLIISLLVLFIVVSGFSTIKIGAVLPVTGGISAFGQLVWEGVQLAHEQISSVLGEEIQLVLVDNRSEKTEAANAVSRAIDREHVVAIIGEVASSHSLAGGQIAEDKKVPMISPSSTNPLVTEGKKFVSRVCFTDPFQGGALAVFSYEKLGVRKVAVFVDFEQDYSVGLSNFFIETFTKLGGQVKKIFYKTGDQEFSAQITQALSYGADAILVTGYYPEIALVAQQAKMLGFSGKILAGDGADAPELVQIGGEAVEGIYFTTHFHPDAKVTDKSKEFVDLFVKKYGKKPSTLAALGYDAYMILVDAIKRAGKADPVLIAQEIRKTKNFEGVTGIITIDEHGNALKSVIVDVVKNGNFEFETVINPDQFVDK